MPDLWEDTTTAPDAFSDEAIEAARAEQHGGQPRDEQGRFVAQEPEPEPEPEVEEDQPVEPEASAVEDEGAPVEEAPDPSLSEIETLTRRLAEKEAMIGRQSTEIGELRQAQEQFAQWAQQVSSQPQVPQDWESLIDQDPAHATQAAYYAGDVLAYQRAAQAWEEMAPGAPGLWAQNLDLNNRLAQLEQSTQGFERDSTNRAKALAVESLKEQYPEMDSEEMIEKMGQFASANPYLMRALESPDPQEVKGAVESLFVLASRGLQQEQVDTLAQRAQEISRSQTEEELRVREEASVASASRTHTERPLSKDEELAHRWQEQEDKLAAGWNVG